MVNFRLSKPIISEKPLSVESCLSEVMHKDIHVLSENDIFSHKSYGIIKSFLKVLLTSQKICPARPGKRQGTALSGREHPTSGQEFRINEHLRNYATNIYSRK